MRRHVDAKMIDDRPLLAADMCARVKREAGRLIYPRSTKMWGASPELFRPAAKVGDIEPVDERALDRRHPNGPAGVGLGDAAAEVGPSP